VSKMKEVVKELTNEAQKEKFMQELGSKAVVERHTLQQDDHTRQLGEVLCDIGRDYNEIEPSIKGMKYLGSIAAHVYVGEGTGTFANIKQIRADNCPAELLMRLGEDLAKATVEYAGKKPGKLRSGW
jgi:hypothetical protein